jgi:hypothetical protein
MAHDQGHDSATKLSDLLTVWRAAERATLTAKTALDSARRAAVAARIAADAVSEMATNAEKTLEAAQRARDVSLRAAREAGAAVDVADAEQVIGEASLADAGSAFGAAKDAYQNASRPKFDATKGL